MHSLCQNTRAPINFSCVVFIIFVFPIFLRQIQIQIYIFPHAQLWELCDLLDVPMVGPQQGHQAPHSCPHHHHQCPHHHHHHHHRQCCQYIQTNIDQIQLCFLANFDKSSFLPRGAKNLRSRQDVLYDMVDRFAFLDFNNLYILSVHKIAKRCLYYQRARWGGGGLQIRANLPIASICIKAPKNAPKMFRHPDYVLNHLVKVSKIGPPKYNPPNCKGHCPPSRSNSGPAKLNPLSSGHSHAWLWGWIIWVHLLGRNRHAQMINGPPPSCIIATNTSAKSKGKYKYKQHEYKYKEAPQTAWYTSRNTNICPCTNYDICISLHFVKHISNVCFLPFFNCILFIVWVFKVHYWQKVRPIANLAIFFFDPILQENNSNFPKTAAFCQLILNWPTDQTLLVKSKIINRSSGFRRRIIGHRRGWKQFCKCIASSRLDRLKASRAGMRR